ncbi:hypothetical protein LAZ67_3005182 [Cordylochernes scorpioides]|uniref:CCHC-type domain-containing protein n=1 Tax=Cordylochernes scorpioides TaxID=51811 RepID=A0ABY6KD93_9ARAC|nr:hypothetical protein LAZ67_3005182 [Cordylochernes scorpioides]
MASTRNYHKGPKQNKDTARSAIQERTEVPSQLRDSTSEYALHVITRKERPTTQDVWKIDSACTSHMTSHGEWIEHKTEERRIIKVAEEGRHIESASSGSIQATLQATHVPNEHCLISKDNSRTAWHRSLGHPSDNKLDLILKNNLLKGLDSINGTLDQCDACSLGKMTKVPYVHTDSNQENYPFEAIYVDLCGPMRINSLGGNSQLPLHFWAEAVNTAAYLYNLIPTTNDPDVSPMEKWKGHSRCRRAYRVFDITARVILEAADIHFIENNNVILEEKQSDNNMDTDTYFFIQEDEQLDNHVLSDADIEEPAPDTMINRQTESSGSDRPQRTRTIPKRSDDYVLATTNETIPKDYDEAIACKDKKHWDNAMLEEIQNMYSHQVWELVPRPVNAKVVKSKWVFKISKDKENKNKTYKARLVAIRYNQIPGRDYNERFSPVINIATLRTSWSMAATKYSIIKLFDVKAAYLNGNIENILFMEQPAGFVQDRNKVCKLIKSIYGLPQSGRSWYDKFSQVLHDYSEDNSNRFINKLRHHLEIKDVTCKGMFLGIKLIQDKEGISLQQSHYVQQILQKYGMENCKEVPTPGSKEINSDNHIKDDNCDQHTYQEALGMLMFLAVNTRPDIAYITSKLSQYSRQPKQMHWTAIKRVMRYMRGTIDLGVKFERGNPEVLLRCQLVENPITMADGALMTKAGGDAQLEMTLALSKDICLLYKPSQDLEADIFTKDLSRDQMKKHLENLSIPEDQCRQNQRKTRNREGIQLEMTPMPLKFTHSINGELVDNGEAASTRKKRTSSILLFLIKPSARPDRVLLSGRTPRAIRVAEASFRRACNEDAWCNHWDETLCLTKVYFYLSGTALKWFENNEESIQTWKEFTSQLENVFGKKENSKLQAEKKLKTRAQLKGESTEFYIQDVLCFCKEADPQMSEEDKISHLMKGIAEELYQALLPRNIQSTEQFITECRRVEALRCRRVTPTRYERLPNVASLCDQDDGEDLSSMIRQIVRVEVQRASGSPREEPQNATIEEIVKEEIGRNLAPISKSRRSPPHKERPRQFLNTRYEAETIRPHPEPRYPKQGGRRDINDWRTTEGRPICFYCGRPGHVVRYCRDRKRHNEERRNDYFQRKQDAMTYQALMKKISKLKEDIHRSHLKISLAIVLVLKTDDISKRNVIFDRAQFNRRYQQDGEAVEEYIRVLHKMAENCNYGSLKEEMIRDRIVVGVKNLQLSEKLQLEPNLTLERAIQAACQTECVKQQQTILRSTTTQAAHFVANIYENGQNSNDWNVYVKVDKRKMLFKMNTGADVTIIL